MARYPANSFIPRANPLRFGPTKSTFMITVMDQQSAWFIPNKTFATSNQNHRFAKMMRIGTGSPISQPRTSTFLRPTPSEIRAANRLQMALVTPKLTMKETIAVFEVKPNSFSPMRGTTVRSSPTIIPTKTLMTTRRENWLKFSRSPRRTAWLSSAMGIHTARLCRKAHIQGPILFRVGWGSRNFFQHVTHKFVPVSDLEGPIEPALKPNRRHRFSAQRPATNRPCKCSRKYFHVVRQRFQLLHGVKQHPRAFLGARGQFRPAHVPNHERMSCHKKPRLKTARLVSHQQRYVFGSVTRSMQHADADIAHVEFIAFVNRCKVEPRTRIRMQDILRTGQLHQLARTGNMVGMKVRVQHIANLHTGFFSKAQIYVNVFQRVAHGGLAFTRATEEIRRSDDRVKMEQLTKDHCDFPLPVSKVSR